MPCGNARVAAQALQHVWITDDLLAQAFHRFARVSHAHRRYGSNIPGPLEARRRLAKRRMGMEAIANSAGPPPSADWGQLFGMGKATPPDFEKGWRWEAPSAAPLRHEASERPKCRPFHWSDDQAVQDFLTVPPDSVDSDGVIEPEAEYSGHQPVFRINDQTTREPSAVSPDHSNVNQACFETLPQRGEAKQYEPFFPGHDQTTDPPLTVPPDFPEPSEVPFDTPIEPDKTDEATYQPYFAGSHPKLQDSLPLDTIETCKASFESLLATLDRDDELYDSEIQPLVDFLNSTSNASAAHLTLRLVQFLSTKADVPEQAWASIAESTKSRAGNLEISDEEMASIFMHLLHDQNGGRELLPVFIKLPRQAHRVFPELTKRVLTSSSDKQEQKAMMRAWLSHVKPRGLFARTDDKPSKPWYMVYDMLSQHFHPSDFPEHFGDIIRSRFGWTLLRHWVPRYTSAPDAAEVNSSATGASNAVPTMFARATYKNFQPGGPRAYFTEGEALEKSFGKLDETPNAYILNDLVQLLAREGLPYDRVVSEIIAVYAASIPNSTTKNLFFDLSKMVTGPSIPVEAATQLMKHFLASGLPSYALYVFESMPSIPLRACYDLPLRLVEEGRTHGSRVLQVLCRSTPDDSLPMHLRPHKGNPLSPEHVEAVHKVAYAWACAPHVNGRIAFRRVWECYRFLRDRRAPMTATMSRAMVKSGITRPLNDVGRLSRMQVQYIMSLVEAIEGRHTAVEVDKLVFEYWDSILKTKGYKPGIQQDQTGRYWLHNRRLWQKDRRKRVLPPNGPSQPPMRVISMYDRPSQAMNMMHKVTLDPEIKVPGAAIDSRPRVTGNLSNMDTRIPSKFIYRTTVPSNIRVTGAVNNKLRMRMVDPGRDLTPQANSKERVTRETWSERLRLQARHAWEKSRTSVS